MILPSILLPKSVNNDFCLRFMRVLLTQTNPKSNLFLPKPLHFYILASIPLFQLLLGLLPLRPNEKFAAWAYTSSKSANNTVWDGVVAV
jgi:hypothetical protein